MKTSTNLFTLTLFALTSTLGCDPVDDQEILADLEEADSENRTFPTEHLAEDESDPESDPEDFDNDIDLPLAGSDAPTIELEQGQVKVFNLCQSLSLYQYNPANHGTQGIPRVEVGPWKKLIWQTLSGTPNGWATVLSAGQEYWGWRYARVECLGGSW